MLALIVLVSSWVTADRVEAVVGEFAILRSDVLARVMEVSGSEAEYDPSAMDPEAFASSLAEIVDERILIEGARAAGFFPSPETVTELVESRLAETRADFGSEEQFLAALATAGLTEEGLRESLFEMIGDQKAASDFVQARTSSSLASLPADPVSYLNSNLPVLEDELMPRNLSWILIPVLPGGPDADSALVLLSDLAMRAASGESFESLARQFSQDPGSAENGGFLGSFGPGDMTPTFEASLDALQPGEISLPFLSPYGAHIARLDSRDSSGTMTASHILLLLELEPADEEAATLLADSIASLLRTGAVSFAEAALRWSADPITLRDGGSLGVVLVRNSLPEAVGLLEESQQGSIAGPVRLGDGSAVAVIRDDGNMEGFDWSGFDREWLNDLVRNVVYQHGINSLVDSLRTTVPVIYASDES